MPLSSPPLVEGYGVWFLERGTVYNLGPIAGAFNVRSYARNGRVLFSFFFFLGIAFSKNSKSGFLWIVCWNIFRWLRNTTCIFEFASENFDEKKKYKYIDCEITNPNSDEYQFRNLDRAKQNSRERWKKWDSKHHPILICWRNDNDITDFNARTGNCSVLDETRLHDS